MKCHYCESTNKETRPYGPKGALVCFKCAMLPEHKSETERNYESQLDDAGPIAIIGQEVGPYPAEHFRR